MRLMFSVKEEVGGALSKALRIFKVNFHCRSTRSL